jgi:hypothetical protein
MTSMPLTYTTMIPALRCRVVMLLEAMSRWVGVRKERGLEVDAEIWNTTWHWK